MPNKSTRIHVCDFSGKTRGSFLILWGSSLSSNREQYRDDDFFFFSKEEMQNTAIRKDGLKQLFPWYGVTLT